jgi:hypothetical protein
MIRQPRASASLPLLLAFCLMAQGSSPRKRSSKPKEAEPYRHLTAEALLRPEIGTQPQFRQILEAPDLHRGNELMVVTDLAEAR